VSVANECRKKGSYQGMGFSHAVMVEKLTWLQPLHFKAAFSRRSATLQLASQIRSYDEKTQMNPIKTKQKTEVSQSSIRSEYPRESSAVGAV
jgi:hypothetical protein